jgi:hypothetical protein
LFFFDLCFDDKNAAVSHITNETLSEKGFPEFEFAEGTMPRSDPAT